MRTYNFEQGDSWNMNQAYLQRLDRRLDERDQARIDGDLLRWYRALRSVYSNIHWKILKPGEEEKENNLDKKFDEAKTKFLAMNNKDNLARQLNSHILGHIDILLDDIDVLLNDLLIAYKLIQVEGEHIDWLEKLKEDLNVKNDKIALSNK